MARELISSREVPILPQEEPIHTQLQNYFAVRQIVCDYVGAALVESRGIRAARYLSGIEETTNKCFRDLLGQGLQLIESGRILMLTNTLLPNLDQDLRESGIILNESVALGAINHAFLLGRSPSDISVGPSPVVAVNTRDYMRKGNDGQIYMILAPDELEQLLDAVAGATVEYLCASPEEKARFVGYSEFIMKFVTERTGQIPYLLSNPSLVS